MNPDDATTLYEDAWGEEKTAKPARALAKLLGENVQ
jgi:hypothetical protein